jgi:hypothetical protein
VPLSENGEILHVFRESADFCEDLAAISRKLSWKTTDTMITATNMSAEKNGLVFISCGQCHHEERELGQALAAAVDELTEFQGYFAENQSSLDGLSRNLFRMLDRCSALVAVMHHRGEVQTPDGRHTRGSVWVEQEIAVAAFLRQAQNRDLQVAVYIQRGLKREGVRDQLQLNPVEFDTEAEVIADFRARLLDGRFTLVRLPPPKGADLPLEL